MRSTLKHIRNLLLTVLGLLIAVAASFLFTGGFGFQEYSDRLLWLGIALSMLGGLVALAGSAKERSQMAAELREDQAGEDLTARVDVRPQPTNPGSRGPRQRSTASYGPIFRFWLLGVICIALAALVSTLWG